MPPVVDSILQLMQIAISNNLHCLSVYRQMDNWSKTVIRTELRNQVKAALTQCELKLEGTQISYLAEELINQVIELPFFQRSVGIFATFDPKHLGGARFILDDNLYVTFSDIPVLDQQCCDQVFTLSPLLKMKQLSHDNLCIYISKKQTRFFLANDEFSPLTEIDNVIVEKMEDRYTDHNPGTGFTQQGSAMDEKKLKFHKKIVNDAIFKAQELASQPNHYQSIIVFFTDDFSSFVDFMSEELHTYASFKPVPVKKVIDADAHFGSEFKKVLQDNFQTVLAEELRTSEDSISRLLLKDEEQLFQMAREGRVHKLYLKENFVREGWVVNRDLPYVEEVVGGVPSRQLVDWMVKRVVDTQGEVYVLDANSDLIAGNAVAKLRY